MDRRELGAGTRLVRAARSLPPGHGEPVVPALVQSVAFDYGSAAEQDAVFGNERPGFVYGRYGTPTTAALEQALAELEGVEAAVCFVSGMAAISAAVDACAISRGARVVAQEDCYGQTRALFERWTRERGADITFVDATDHAAVERALAILWSMRRSHACAIRVFPTTLSTTSRRGSSAGSSEPSSRSCCARSPATPRSASWTGSSWRPPRRPSAISSPRCSTRPSHRIVAFPPTSDGAWASATACSVFPLGSRTPRT